MRSEYRYFIQLKCNREHFKLALGMKISDFWINKEKGRVTRTVGIRIMYVMVDGYLVFKYSVKSEENNKTDMI